MRTCKLCGKEAEESEFTWKYSYHADGTKVKLIVNVCKSCSSKRQWQYTKSTKETDPCGYYANANWKSLNQRCVGALYSSSPSILNSPQMQAYHAKGIELHLTKEELEQFWRSNEAKVKEILANGETPTLDRINDKGHYSLDNIQILTRGENIRKSRGIAENPQKIPKEKMKEYNRTQYLKNKKKEE